MSLPFLCEVLQQNNLFAGEIRFVSFSIAWEGLTLRIMGSQENQQWRRKASLLPDHLAKLTSDKNLEEESQSKGEPSPLACLLQSHKKIKISQQMLKDFPQM